MPVATEVGQMLTHATSSMMGGMHWGNASYRWESNEMATTVLAFEVLKKAKGNEEALRRIVQYFLEKRQRGKWMNTVESASVVSTILPFVLEQSKSFAEPPHLAIAGDTALNINAFPFTQVMRTGRQPVTVSKSGGGIVYFTAWQRVMNKEPLPVTDNFIIDTWFEHNGQRITSLTAGERATMKIRVHVLKDASYVRISVPIPAGCTYAEKKQESFSEHREFRKNRMDMFVEQMNTGIHEFTIELEPRYTGSYQVNPARAELMYFPVLFGRDGGKRVSIGK
jgi:alpha-2-macroglobulin